MFRSWPHWLQRPRHASRQSGLSGIFSTTCSLIDNLRLIHPFSEIRYSLSLGDSPGRAKVRSWSSNVRGRVNSVRQREHSTSSAVSRRPSAKRLSVLRVSVIPPRRYCNTRSSLRVTAPMSRCTTSRAPIGALTRCETLIRIHTPFVKNKRQQPRWPLAPVFNPHIYDSAIIAQPACHVKVFRQK
jgi:hypothetical protein